MRWIVLVIVGLLGCEHGEGGGIFCLFEGDVHSPGDFFSAGDACNSCSCEADGRVTCSHDTCGDGGVDAIQGACSPAGVCQSGPECGGLCCGVGEQCFDGICSCGGGQPCLAGDICATGGGPVPEPGGDGGAFGVDPTCGFVCCGASQPCPL